MAKKKCPGQLGYPCVEGKIYMGGCKPIMCRTCNGTGTPMAKKKELNPWPALLRVFDPKYFNDEDGGRKPKNLDDAAYDLSTWFFDNEKKSALKKMIEKLPEELWQLALKKWANGQHDT